jgi:tripartite-type tricarboxylate transporter receptor subunit TctC
MFLRGSLRVAIFRWLRAPAKTRCGGCDAWGAIITILEDSEVIANMRKQGAAVLRGYPAEFTKLIASEIPRWASAVEAIGLKLDH